jgi:hypothetical protein
MRLLKGIQLINKEDEKKKIYFSIALGRIPENQGRLRFGERRAGEPGGGRSGAGEPGLRLRRDAVFQLYSQLVPLSGDSPCPDDPHLHSRGGLHSALVAGQTG